jgi:uncharacterized protein (TIGR03790 family)
MKKTEVRRQKSEVRRRGVFPFCLLTCVFCLLAFSAPALEADQLLLITNKNAPQGRKLADFYAQKRHVPDGRVLELDLPTAEEMSADAYDRNVVPAVREFLRAHALERKVTCLVTFYGTPIRIAPRVNDDRDRQELAMLQAEQQALAAKVQPRVEAMEELATEANPAFTRAAGGNDVESLTRRADGALRDLAKVIPHLPAEQRDAMHRRAMQALSPLVGPVGMLERQILEARLAATQATTQSTTRLAATTQATTQAAEKVTAFRRELALLQERKFDRDARAKLREQVAANLGPFEYAKVLASQIMYFQTDNTAAAFDSELSLVWWDYPRSGYLGNPLHYGAAALKGPPVLMVMRLDGPDAGTVSEIILASLKAEAAGLKGNVVIDSRGLAATRDGQPDTYGAYDQTLRNLYELVHTKTKLTTLFDDRPEVLPAGSAKDVAIYMGWYSVDKYVPACQFVTGAVGFHLASFTMMTLKRDDPRCWVRNLQNDGIAATLGAVAEPYLQAFPNADDFFPLLLTGKLTLAEVYWKTTPMTSWMISMIGDPLYTPYKVNPALAVEDLPPRLRAIFDKPN